MFDERVHLNIARPSRGTYWLLLFLVMQYLRQEGFLYGSGGYYSLLSFSAPLQACDDC